MGEPIKIATTTLSAAKPATATAQSGAAAAAQAIPGAAIPAAQVAPVVDPARAAFEMLLQTEAEARRAPTVPELRFLIANDMMRICRARQTFVTSVGAKPRIEQVSSISTVDRDSPRIRWVETILQNFSAEVGLGKRKDFVLPAYAPTEDVDNNVYPFRYILWAPLLSRQGEAIAGVMLAREIPWNEQDQMVAGRLAETYAHAWLALQGKSTAARRFKPKWLALGVVAALVAAGFIPVPLTVLAPAEVVSIDPQVVTAPIDGVIEEVLVSPNQIVEMDQPVVRLSATSLRNELAVAERNIEVAGARLKQVTQGAVADVRMRAEMAIARSELALAEAKRDYARDMLAKTEIRAPSRGVAVFSDPRDWIGRPVSTGERVMEVADPAKLQLRVDVPVADSIALSEGARVRAFLDSNPLKTIDASLRRISFEAQTLDNNQMAYRTYADLADQSQTRLGTRGTAQLYGDDVPLAFYVFRRPVASMRQWLGL